MRSQKNEDIIKNMRKGRTTYCFLYQALVGIFVLGYVQSLKAEELPSQEVKAQSCEPIKSDETLSSARVRAIDAASFKAVSGLESLKSYKEELDSHDFNVMVYGIVDNYLEDVVAQTTEQSAEQICVEVKGYVSGQNLIQGINESFERQTKQEELTDETADKAADLSQAVTQVLDQATEKFEEHQKEALADKEIVYAEPSAEQVPQAEIKETVAPKEEQAPLSQEKLTPKEGLIYVAATEFFDGSSSDYYSAIVKNWFSGQKGFLITEKPETADFILHPKILRAKVDEVDGENNRLQMVTALELVYTDSGKSYTEHQNRFVVYGKEDGEQDVAYKLMKKLLENSCEELQLGMETYIRKKYPKEKSSYGLPSVITPVKTPYPTEDDE